MTRNEFLRLLANLLVEIFNPDPLCTDNERHNEHRAHKHIGHIFVLL